jgi:putative flippase GtrA
MHFVDSEIKPRTCLREDCSRQQVLRIVAVEMLSAKQFLFFCIVGVATTFVDFAVFNLLTRPAVGWRRIPANLVSVTVAMIWSFLANWFVVFHPDGHDWLQRASRFLVTTAFSAFVLQNVVLYLATYLWKWPSSVALFVVRALRLHVHFNDDVVSRNTCKALAVSAGLVWNFCWYKFFVYAT